jgi:hypothetical protein
MQYQKPILKSGMIFLSGKPGVYGTAVNSQLCGIFIDKFMKTI